MSNLSTPEPDPVHPPEGECVADLVIADHVERKAFGIDKYGDCLKDDDGRNPAVDLYQELLDASVYGRKLVRYIETLLARIKVLEDKVAWYDAQPIPINFTEASELPAHELAEIIKAMQEAMNRPSAAPVPTLRGQTPPGVYVDEHRQFEDAGILILPEGIEAVPSDFPVPTIIAGSPSVGEKVAAELIARGAEVTEERAVTSLLGGWPKAYADFPWSEIDGVQSCAYCGEEQLDGTAMRKDPEGMVCMNCVVVSRQERRAGSRGL